MAPSPEARASGHCLLVLREAVGCHEPISIHNHKVEVGGREKKSIIVAHAAPTFSASAYSSVLVLTVSVRAQNSLYSYPQGRGSWSCDKTVNMKRVKNENLEKRRGSGCRLSERLCFSWKVLKSLVFRFVAVVA